MCVCVCVCVCVCGPTEPQGVAKSRAKSIFFRRRSEKREEKKKRENRRKEAPTNNIIIINNDDVQLYIGEEDDVLVRTSLPHTLLNYYQIVLQWSRM